MKKVFILSAVRTPMGSFGSMFASLSAIDLGIAAVKGALEKADVQASSVEELFFGNVCSANLGQSPARQVALGAGIGSHVPSTLVNKVCASGMKSVMFAAQSIALGQADIIVAGGMESMSNTPYYVPKARWGYKYGDAQLIDGLSKDGLTDPYFLFPMGNHADSTAKKYGISREEQDRYAIRSYKCSAQSWEKGYFNDEVVAVNVPQRRGEPLSIKEDEEHKRVKFEKVSKLRPAFSKEGTVTAANASTINDGASALVLASEEKVKQLGLKPVAQILAYADAAHDPEWFTTAPTLAAPKVLKRAGMELSDINYLEVNEAFAVVPIAFNQLLKVHEDKVNVFGGAVSLGHPLGASGARILTTLNNVLQHKDAELGLAAICNGGGGASAMIIKRVN
ncbi:MAG: acetyl-CoA C-acyltransferase [Bacteroidetes bacterium]|nr:acetyl-CoA C-acyltransferase [Bacteroidota bacterium]